MINSTLSAPGTTDLSLEHLQAELIRIDVLIHREVRRWQLAGQDQNDAFRGQYVSDAEATALLQRPFAVSWGQTVTLASKEQQAYSRAIVKAEKQVAAIVKSAESKSISLRLVQLATAFGLNRFELDVLLICLAPALDLGYERLYGYLQDDITRKRPTINLALDLLCESGPGRLLSLSYFADDAPLIKYKLLERISDRSTQAPLLNQVLNLDETIVTWLLDRYQPHHILGKHASLLHPHDIQLDILRHEAQLDVIHLLSQQPILVFYGVDWVRQMETAKFIAARANRALLIVDLAAVIKSTEESPLPVVQLALRDACLTGAIPCLTGWDACIKDETPPAALMTELCLYPDSVIVVGKNIWRPQNVDRNRNLFWFHFPMPSYSERKDLWIRFLGPDAPLETLKLDDVAGQFSLTTGQIRDVIAAAKDTSVQERRAVENEDIFAAARAYSSSGLNKLAKKIKPRYDWDDMVLSEDQKAMLRELVGTVRGRPKVLEEWKVGQKLASSAGVTALFAGPPGTGKTMAAEVIAGELGLDLYKIDLSTVVSKYIGETEKNLEKIFQEAESSNAILFFDEADSLFGKRSEVRDSHDRYANIEISYLLQRMEAYDGVTILATNLGANLDEAFTRRLSFSINFPFPEEEERLRIWQSLFPPSLPRAGDLDLPLMARRFKMAGGNIRNVIVSAAYLAAADGGTLTMQHLLHGTRRELQKMGRLVNEKDMVID
jgi:AAA+ superfamily predicted ATPase